MVLKNTPFFLCIILSISCHITKKTDSGIAPIHTRPMKDSVQQNISPKKSDVFLEGLLKSRPHFFNNFLAKSDSLNIQIIYTQIDRHSNNQPQFKTYYYNVNPAKYFYPASTVKMPVALLALQRLNELRVFGLNSNSTMVTESGFSGQTSVYNDPTTSDGRPSIAHYVKKIFLVSDNEAFNRLYEFLGQEYINERLQKMGYQNVEILHRLSIALNEEENRHTNPVKFFNEEGKNLYSQPMQVNKRSYPPRNDSAGKGYISGDHLMNSPMNFSKKNRIGLEDLTNILRSILFPSAVPEKERFNLKPEEYRFVWKCMSQLPSETTYPSYDSANYWDSYVKFLLYGAVKGELSKNIRIFNKVGDAYGFLTDVAYIVDFTNNIEFILSATIYCNSDGILNDDRYEYDTVGFPFMKQLGELIYEYELKRGRPTKPDLSEFILMYDK